MTLCRTSSYSRRAVVWGRAFAWCSRAADAGAKDVRVNFRTVRPADYSTPYETLLKNQVHFAAVDKGNNRLLNILVRPSCGPRSCTRSDSAAEGVGWQ